MLAGELREELLWTANQGAVAQIRRGSTDGLLNFAYMHACMYKHMYSKARHPRARAGKFSSDTPRLPAHCKEAFDREYKQQTRVQRSIASLPAGTWRL